MGCAPDREVGQGFLVEILDARPVDEVREQFLRSLTEHPGKAYKCPTCSKTCAVYKESINADQARALVHFYKEFRQEWGTFEVIRKLYPGLNRRKEDKLRHWGLIETERVGYRDGKNIGSYVRMRVTDAGVQWLMRERTVPKYALVYNKTLLGMEGDEVSIDECLAKKEYELAELLLYSSHD